MLHESCLKCQNLFSSWSVWKLHLTTFCNPPFHNRSLILLTIVVTVSDRTKHVLLVITLNRGMCRMCSKHVTREQINPSNQGVDLHHIQYILESSFLRRTHLLYNFMFRIVNHFRIVLINLNVPDIFTSSLCFGPLLNTVLAVVLLNILALIPHPVSESFQR